LIIFIFALNTHQKKLILNKKTTITRLEIRN